ncbi:MAG: hypothetical protein KDD82_02210, partial [Planctomycetes bacterium]|nr:hypothetical protein [Planctomycetota bacterium]
TWPGAKKGIVKVLELILKKYGRIGGAANIQSYAAQLSGGAAGLGAGQLGGLAGQARRQLGSGLGSVPGIAGGGGSGRLPRLDQLALQ